MKLARTAAVALSALLLVAGCSAAQDTQNDTTEDQLAASEAPLARFATPMKNLKTVLEGPGTDAEIANTLLASGRSSAFSLQAICRVYSKLDPKFKEMRDDFKGLEDGIGNYDKWNGIYERGVSDNKDAATLARLKKQRDDALTSFVSLLTAKQWRTDGNTPTRMAQHEAFLKGFKWLSQKEDRKLVLEQLSDEMKDLKKTQYDMKILEVGDGVHELRRDMRWVLIEQLGMNGMIVLKDGADGGDVCPIPAYSALPAGDRYTQLRSTAVEPNPCQINLCLVAAAAKAVSDLDAVKTEAELQVNVNGANDVVPVALQPKAQALYDDLVTNDLFGQYKTQLDACKDAQK